MSNGIAGERISCKPQKLQSKTATVKIRGGDLNELRLTEASRLLTEKCSAAVSEIAYAVGYEQPADSVPS